MGQTLENGIYLPDEGERNCYEGLAANWTALDGMIGGYNVHISNTTIHVTAADKEAWNGKADASALTAHTGDTTIHVTAADKQAWNGKADASALTAHTGDTTIHVTAADKQAWNGKQDALSQTQLDAVNSGIDSTKVQQIVTNTSDISSLQSGKANDSSVVHKSGEESIIGNKRFGVVQSFTGYPSIRLYSTDDDINVIPSYTQQQDIRYTDKNNNVIAYFVFQHRTDANEPFRTCWRQNRLDGTNNYYSVDFNNLGEFYPENNNGINLGRNGNRWKSVYATNYYYGNDNVEFSTKFVTTDTAQTISGQKIFNDINTISSSSEIGVSGGNISFNILDKNNKILARLQGGTFSTGMAYSYWLVNNGTDAFNGISLYQASANLVQLRPYDSTLSAQLGASNRYFTNCYTSKVNNLEPSSLSLPSGNANKVIDISSYITNLDGTANSYTVPANGWISIAVVGTAIDIVSSSWSDSRLRASSGNVRMLYPVLKNETLAISVTGTTLAYARFIPCQGNV